MGNRRKTGQSKSIKNAIEESKFDSKVTQSGVKQKKKVRKTENSNENQRKALRKPTMNNNTNKEMNEKGRVKSEVKEEIEKQLSKSKIDDDEHETIYIKEEKINPSAIAKKEEPLDTTEPKLENKTTEKTILENQKERTNEENDRKVQNADLLGLILAKSDPGLVKVLIDNSSPENLNVFLEKSNITLDELKDIVAY